MRRTTMNRLAVTALAGVSLVPAAIAEDSEKPWSQADAVWGDAEMAQARDQLLASHGDLRTTYLQAERFEVQLKDGEEVLLLDGNAWIGGDTNKLWIKTELEYLPDGSAFEEAELQVLWSRAVSPYFDFQTGIRYDFEPEGRAHLVAGFQGLAPYLFELDGAAFLSDDGDLTARIEAEYEFLLSQRLILQPRAEIGFSASEIPELETGAGLTGIDVGLRLRYEFSRQFAPYIGVEWQESLGDTADYVESAGGESGEAVFLIGLRAWY